ncbi:MAG: hypothetical protein HYX48_07655 [Chlamydiales bacterium]|nr:hypothetical protein [Chlamydiales bacterium]
MKKFLLFILTASMLLLQMRVDASDTISSDGQKQELARGLPNVSSRTAGSWDLSADAFAWYASEEASAIWADVLKIGKNTSSFGVPDINFNWDFGFRVGAGRNLEYDQWDTQLNWTWFRTEAHKEIHLLPEFISIAGKILITEEIHPEFFAADLGSNFAESAKIRWSILFNMFDWELGRTFWVSKGLSLRPFIGLKGGWIDQSIHVNYKNLIIANAFTSSSAKEQVKNNFWGIGPVGGVNTKWKLRNFGTHFPSLFGDFSIATLWGTWSCSDVYKETTGKRVSVHTRNSTLGALMLRGFLGTGWDVDIKKGRSHFSTRVGYEMQLWVNQLRVATSQLVRLHGDLTLQGVTLNCRFDF